MPPDSSISLQPIEQRTVTEIVVPRLEVQLSNGDLKQADKLPTERQLARQLKVGRTRVREALKLLNLGGFSTRAPATAPMCEKSSTTCYPSRLPDPFFSAAMIWR